MDSLKQAFNEIGITPPASIRKSLQTHPDSLQEIIRILKLPDPDWSQIEPTDDDFNDYIYEFEEAGPQGITFARGNMWFFSTEMRVHRYRITGSDSFRPNIVQPEKSIYLAELIDAAADLYGLTFGTGHIGDLSYSQGVIFAPIKNDLAMYNNKPHVIFGMDEELRLVAWAELELNTSDAFCAIHPWNGFLYTMGTEAQSTEDKLKAYDITEFFNRLLDTANWGVRVDMPRRRDADIHLKTPTGDPDRYWAQGLAFSKNGRIYVTRSEARSDGGPWDNRLYVYSALTGKRFGDYKEYDFESNFGWDEFEGITVHPSGVLYAVVTNCQKLGTDDFNLYTFRFRNLPPDAV